MADPIAGVAAGVVSEEGRGFVNIFDVEDIGGDLVAGAVAAGNGDVQAGEEVVRQGRDDVGLGVVGFEAGFEEVNVIGSEAEGRSAGVKQSYILAAQE